MKNRFAVLLAAGQGTRMKSKLYKVLHPILKQPMIHYVLDALAPVGVSETVTVVGHGADQVKSSIGNRSNFVVQEEQLGTAHAVLQTEELLKNKQGTTIVVCGDTPLITSETYNKLFEHHENEQAKATILTTKVDNPAGYGRVIRNETNDVEKIVEHKDANNEELTINEINTGTYCFDNEALFEALLQVDNDNVQNEYYLPDVVEILKSQGEKVSAYITEDADETIGINDRAALSEAEMVMKKRINLQHAKNGVSIMDLTHTYISPEVEIEGDVVIYPGTMLTGNTTVKSGAIIGPHSEIDNSTIGKDTVIRQSIVINSKIGDTVNIGPFAHIRPDTSIGDHVKVGNFVEVKHSVIDDTTKVPHLSYIGDSELGKGINIGSGTTTVNYDGVNKHKTTIGDNAFIGCNTNLVAPVNIDAGAFVAAGTTVTKNVPEDALAIARAKQVNKEGYASKIKKQNQQ
ncbi:MAG TPA: bifunctional UDP-N-acetylglucosamine diphosphorylase/glucosamine-1-phosphate N-acetyltransferase GlmU [Pseudogracilibacillus sp.]|nr:bifunctional UDP-N-acetylglucosamine diphosphorylase/glucosamine-1-phosphate N-acetyltransferase GlmU [Pseudogracilibacillus sp.]